MCSRPTEYGTHPFIVVPEDTNGNGLPDQWFRDDNGDGLNDLLLQLGPPSSHLPGLSYEGYARDINDSGQVVGDCRFFDTGERLMFVVTPADVNGDGRLEWYWPDANGANTLMTRLEIGLPVGTGAFAEAINKHGQIVGRYFPPNSERGFLLEGLDTDANGVADTWFQDADQNGLNDLVTELGTARNPSGNVGSLCAVDINDAGWVVGYSHGAFLIKPKVDPATGKRLWNEDQNGDGNNDLAIFLPTLGGTSSFANAINSDGVIVGSSTLRNKDTSHAVLWRLDAQGRATITDLGTMRGLDNYAGGINSNLQVVGGGRSQSAGGNLSYAAWFWQNGVMTELSRLVQPGVVPGNYVEMGAADINDLGMFVGDVYGAFIAIPNNVSW